MNNITFRYIEHPGDLLRNTDLVKLPSPDNNLEDFLICFLNDYQSDDRVAYLDDLSKLLNGEFPDEIEEEKFIKMSGVNTENEIQEEIEKVVDELKNESYRDFYNLVMNNKVELIIDGEK